MIQRLLVEMPKTFAGFPPLGLVLAVMIGIGVADKTGLIAAALKAFMSAIPNALLTAALIFAGIMSSIAVDAGFVVVIPLGAVLFAVCGISNISMDRLAKAVWKPFIVALIVLALVTYVPWLSTFLPRRFM